MRAVEIMEPKEYLTLKREDKLSDQEIADNYHVGMATLQRWKKRHNLKAGRAEKDYIKIKAKGYEDWQIAAKWGITPCALYQWKKVRGLIKKGSFI